MYVDITSLRTRVKKLKHEQEELENTFKDLQKRQQERLLSKVAELDRRNLELRTRIETLEFNSDDEEEEVEEIV
jgi:chromosome segregation ATPase